MSRAPLIFLTVFVLLGASSIQAQDQPNQRISRECALHDLDLITEIEIARDANFPATYLVIASEMQITARKLCYGGDELRALRLYQAIRMLQERPIAFRGTGD